MGDGGCGGGGGGGGRGSRGGLCFPNFIFHIFWLKLSFIVKFCFLGCPQVPLFGVVVIVVIVKRFSGNLTIYI